MNVQYIYTLITTIIMLIPLKAIENSIYVYTEQNYIDLLITE